MNPPPVYSETLRVKSYETDFQNRWKPHCVQQALQEASSRHAALLGYGYESMFARGMAWILSRMRIDFAELPPMGEEVVVRTWVKGRGEPVQLDYRLERTPGQGSGWKIYDLNVLGVWLVDNYRPQFAQQINAGGIDALIHSLAERNQANARGDKG